MVLESFLDRVKKYESRKVKVIEKEVEGFGKIQFYRPKQEVLLEYLASLSSQATPKANSDNVDMDIELDLGLVARAASKLVYECCTEIQNKDVRAMYQVSSYYDIPLEMFGVDKVIELGSFISEEFGAVKVKEEIVEDIKNSLEVVGNTESYTG